MRVVVLELFWTRPRALTSFYVTGATVYVHYESTSVTESLGLVD